MFKFRLESLIRLRENERDVARAAVAEAYSALQQINQRLESLAKERAELDRSSLIRRQGTISVDRLLSDGRYERQIAGDVAQIRTTGERIEAEILRRQAVLAAANAGVRQIELLREKELAKWHEAQAKITQANLDEVAARRQRVLMMNAPRADEENS